MILLPAALVVLAGATLPTLVEALLGRDATWAAALYTWPALVVFVLAATTAAAATLLARIWQWTQHRGSTGADEPTQMAPASVLSEAQATS